MNEIHNQDNNKKIEGDTMREERTVESMTILKDYDTETTAFINNVFNMIANECRWHCEDEFDIELDEEIKIELCNTKEYMNKCDSILHLGGLDQLFTFGQYFYDSKGKVVLIHGHENTIGMMNWMSDFYQFNILVNTIMELAASDRHMQYYIRDKDFSKKLFEEVQERVQKRNAA